MTRTASRKSRTAGVRALLLCAALLALLSLALAPAALAESSPAADTTTFRVGWLLEPDNLNPFIGLLGQDYEIWHLNYDFLVGWDPKDFSPRPEIAESWEVSDDGKTWTFTIRQGVKWQDGEPLTARDVAFTFNYIIENELSTLDVYTRGIVSAEAPDDATCVITTDRPKANMLSTVVPILPEHIWSKVSGKDAASTYQNAVPIVGSGPFQVVEWQKGKFLRLVANKDYWGGAPKVDELIFENYRNADTMSADLKSGGIDAAIELPLAQVPSLQSAPNLTVLKGTHWRFNELGFNCYDSPNSLGNPVLLDEKFRQALSWAIDRQKICDVAFFGQADVGSTLLPPYSAFHYEPVAGELFTYDPEEAKTQLDLAGYEDVNGDGLRETTDGKPLDLDLMVTNDSPENKTAAKLIAGWFNDVGVKVTLRIVDAGVLLDAQYNYKGDVYAPDYDMFIWFWTQDSDPSFMLAVPTKDNIEGWNDTLWWSPETDKLFNDQDQALDVDQRIAAAQEMQKLVYQASNYLIFSYPYQMEGYNSDKWEGVVPSPSDIEGYDGSAFYNYQNIDTYKFVSKKTATTTEDGGANTTVLLIVGIVVAIIVVAIILMVVRRRAARSEVE